MCVTSSLSLCTLTLCPHPLSKRVPSSRPFRILPESSLLNATPSTALWAFRVTYWLHLMCWVCILAAYTVLIGSCWKDLDGADIGPLTRAAFFIPHTLSFLSLPLTRTLPLSFFTRVALVPPCPSV